MGKKKSAGKGLDDERFSRIKSDPMFAGMKNTDKKVVIDKRFAAALTDERFATRAKVDMRGRKQNKSIGNNMLDLYELEEDNQEKPIKKTAKVKKAVVEEDKELDDFFDEDEKDEDVEADDEEDEEDVGDEEEDDEEEEEEVGTNGFKKLDLARGEGNVESSSDEDSSDEEDVEDEEVQRGELDLGNLAEDAEQVEWTSRRLAVCNLEWDNMSCEDILMLVKSFVPQGGSVVSVGIYLSDFGKEQLEKEDKMGPSVRMSKPVEADEDGKATSESRLAVREYLVNKLKYYYAVITFSSVETAVAVYEECDGFELEETGIKMDMRFVPDEMEFEEDRVKSFLNAEDVNLTKYKTSLKSKSAMNTTGSKITWDDDDRIRSRKFRDAFNGDEDAGKDLIVDSDGSDDEEKRNTLMALLNTDEKKSGFEVDWDGEGGKGKVGDDSGSESSDGEYVKVDDDDDEIGVSQKRKGDSDEEEEKPEEKLTGYKAYKKKQKAKLMENKLKRKAGGDVPETNIKTAAAAESIAKDDRFSALFTDSAFAIEPSNKKFKGSLLVTKQAESKAKGDSEDALPKTSSKPEDLVSKLKARADKWSKKKGSK